MDQIRRRNMINSTIYEFAKRGLILSEEESAKIFEGYIYKMYTQGK